MKKELELIALALAFGMIMWIVDAFLDYQFFYFDYKSFMEVLITDMPPRAGYMRSIVMLAFVIYSLIVGKHIEQARKDAEEHAKEPD